MVHLKIAQEFLANNNINDAAAFYKGSLAPDSIMFRPGCKRSDKELTHFCVGDEGWGYYTNYNDWENSLRNNVKNYTGRISNDFLLGYFAHVYTDILYTKYIWTPTRLANDDSLIKKYIDDCFEIDSRLLESLNNKDQIWAMLNETKEYYLPDISAPSDMSRLIDAMMTDMYFNRKSNRKYKFTVISLSDMLDFTENAARKLDEQYSGFFMPCKASYKTDV
jgi:hypothetical protein